MTYRVINWNTDEVIATFNTIQAARVSARSQGHDPDAGDFFTTYPPVAYVADESGNLVYNPRFKKETR